jgi:hypothetical protein
VPTRRRRRITRAVVANTRTRWLGNYCDFSQRSHPIHSDFTCKGRGQRKRGEKLAMESIYLGWLANFLSCACENRLQTRPIYIYIYEWIARPKFDDTR